MHPRPYPYLVHEFLEQELVVAVARPGVVLQVDRLHLLPVVLRGQKSLGEVGESAPGEVQLTEGEGLGVQGLERVGVDESETGVVPM